MALLLCAPAFAEPAAEPPAPEDWALHGQATFIEQYHPAFRSAYRGANSLDPGSRGNETVNITAYGGARLWDGGEAWADLEMDQGFGLSDTLGVAAFTNGEGSKVGKAIPYLRLHRLFFRQSFDLGGEAKALESQANQLAGSRTEDSLVVTLGKFSPTDIFDTNLYAHDPSHDFLNWGMIDAAPWDYAADAWGYSYGGAAEWTVANWTVRGDCSTCLRIPNGTELTRGFGQYQLDEGSRAAVHAFHPGWQHQAVGFCQPRAAGRLQRCGCAVAGHSQACRHRRRAARRLEARHVAEPTWQQGLTDDLGAFARATWDDGSKEGDDFTDMTNSVSAGLSLKGASWDRKEDTVGLALETGGISKAAQRFFAAGGLEHPDRRRAAGPLRPRECDRSLLRRQAVGRHLHDAGLPVHRQSCLQCRSRPGVGAGSAPARRVLNRGRNANYPANEMSWPTAVWAIQLQHIQLLQGSLRHLGGPHLRAMTYFLTDDFSYTAPPDGCATGWG